MLRMTPTRSAENLPLSMNRAEDTEVGSRTSSTTRLAENSPLNMPEDIEVGGNGDGGDDETVEKSLLSTKSNKPIEYLTSLRFNADSALFAKK